MRFTLTVKKASKIASKLTLNTRKISRHKKKEIEINARTCEAKRQKIDRPSHFQRPGLGAEISDAPAWALKLSACQKFSFQKCSSFYPHTTEK